MTDAPYEKTMRVIMIVIRPPKLEEKVLLPLDV
jgi:hypothetical protein